MVRRAISTIIRYKSTFVRYISRWLTTPSSHCCCQAIRAVIAIEPLEPSSCHAVKPSSRQAVRAIKPSSHQAVKLSSHQANKPSSRQANKPSRGQVIELSSCRAVKPLSCQVVESSCSAIAAVELSSRPCCQAVAAVEPSICQEKEREKKGCMIHIIID